MKTINEIKNKIDEYLCKIENLADSELKENYCRVIDALLWVIDDNSGAAI